MKHVALLLSIVCLLVFVACGQGDKTEKATEMAKEKAGETTEMVKGMAKEKAGETTEMVKGMAEEKAGETTEMVKKKAKVTTEMPKTKME